MGKKVSIVIPVYNVEKYLRACLDSVIEQTYKNLQIILVDDGSTDSSGAICDEYAEKDTRIIVIHQENQGAGAAKNTGLELVDGEYLSLIDSDDFIDKRFYEIMIGTIERYNADVVQCLFDNCYVNVAYKVNYHFPSANDRSMQTKQFLFELLYDWKYAIFANKVFKTELLNEARFPVGRKIDDEFFTYKLIGNAKKIVNINQHLYHYRMRGSSVMNNNSSVDKFRQDRLECFTERMKYIEQRFPTLKKDYYKHLSNNYGELYPSDKNTFIQKVRTKILLRDYLYDDRQNLVGDLYE